MLFYANLFSRIMNNYFKTLSYYLIAPLISFAVLFLYFDFNIFKYGDPILFGDGDYIALTSTIKLIIKEGLTYCSTYLGHPQIDTNCFSDYGINNSILSFWIIRFFTFFSANPFVVSYFFAYFSIFLIAISANFCFREIGISKFNSTALSVLFSITNNKIAYLVGLTVGNYFIIPFALLISFSIINGKVNALKVNESGKIFISPNKYFYYAMIVGCLASISSAYYGYLFIIILFLSGVILFFRNLKLNKAVFSVAIIIILLIIISILINFTTLIFWLENGKNDIITRRYIEITKYGISIASLMLPIEDHVIKSFGEFAIAFKKAYLLNWEKGFHQLGALASIGFCSLLGFSLSSMFLIHKKDLKYKFYGLEFKQEKYYILSVIASLNLLLILFLHSESFLLFLHFYFMGIRAISRFNVIFIFLSLVFFGIIFDELIAQKKIFKKTIFTKIIITIICSLALIDGVGGPTKLSKNFANNKKNYENQKAFVENIEKSIPIGSKIFMMPVKGFPEDYYDNYQSVIGYIFSKELNFSYPVPKNRKSHLWQREVVDLKFQDFVKKIKEKGFVGIWIQRDIFEKIEKKVTLIEFENNVKKIAKNVIESGDKIFIFYEI
jgi:hypothetical protein